ncbi:4-diphosphocytidyl-2-C-methyl-D-erythritol kinase [Jannaschia pagri]|uniref:4-diphosphocytidyl-2-C-methyl-D-erythritol kinase n=1 Tax=Jannaschia pagri TaxID=2829797 RepID=A0ABQ4NHD2_9RHOB|nr:MULTISPECIES: 4-(cytidine 5'-diphospho)-2-C-methyl-D-erythritol kinase [unclassified Jannaschia]GIT90073.1 4-diphosphocytidyl-2-C-methyl-D-erythritol kinase [Jannaschia sp. AI_61]GIT93821.1 4-diphosphocytidyl-2-C-methyl-D-erythritol kinase [Jannaschia sp. AI_62]
MTTQEPGFAPAKVNLTLHVTGRRPDGYHLLDSLVVFADVGDRLSVAPGDSLTVTGPFTTGVPTDDGNLVRRALAVVGQSRAVTLEKNLPHPAGIGGGSSDAAAVLRLVGAAPTDDQALALGADVPVCLRARAARMQGIGDRVTGLDLPPLHGVLVNPGVAVPTGAVFAGLSSTSHPGHVVFPDLSNTCDVLSWIAAQRNDLEASARAIAPVIGEVLDRIAATGASVSRMSGSGATCFGLYPSEARAAEAASRLDHPGWWVRPVRLT